MLLVKIGDNILNLKNEEIQYDIFKTPTISLSFDIIKYPSYKKIIIDIWDNQNTISSLINSSYKINLSTPKYEAIGCFIKMIDISDTEIKSIFSCDYFKESLLQERRDIILNKILD